MLGSKILPRLEVLDLSMGVLADKAAAALTANAAKFKHLKKLVLDDNWPSRRTGEGLGAQLCANYVAYRRELRGGQGGPR